MWAIVRDIRDRGRLKLRCYVGFVLQPGGQSDATRYLFWHVTNVGSRPVTVTPVGGTCRKAVAIGPTPYFFIKTASFPKTLQPGDYHVEPSHAWQENAEHLKSLSVTNSLGRTYRAPLKDVRAVRKAATSPALDRVLAGKQ